jgi:hypothetical protein
MISATKGSVWTGSQLAARLVALKGVPPDAVHYVLYRETWRPDGDCDIGYCLGEGAQRLDESAFLDWSAEQGLEGPDRLAIAVLIIREVLDTAGRLRECVLERRRGAVDGPFHGDPARIEFTGPAQMVRFYRVLRNGRLREIAASPEAAPPWPRLATRFTGEIAALRAQFGEAVEVLDLREPTLFEELAGLSSIAHLRLPDDRQTAAGVGWFGTLAYVLEAAFPRFGNQLALAPDEAAAVERVLRDNDLSRHEVRLDERGVCVMARRRRGLELFQIRVEDGGAELEAYDPRPESSAGPDQARWMLYAERGEALTVLDAWREGPGDELAVLTGDAGGRVWRHTIDWDGVEIWRRPDENSAAGVLHHERLFPGEVLGSDVASTPVPTAAPPRLEAPEADTVLARVQAHGAAIALLTEARRLLTTVEAGGTDAGALSECLRALAERLAANGAPVAARAASVLSRTPPGPEMTGLLDGIECRFNDEMALVRLAPVQPVPWIVADDDGPFGAAVAYAFPSASYDIEEAVRCLALRRPTAAMLHAARVLTFGLAALAALTGAEFNESDRWPAFVMRLRASDDTHPGAADALSVVRRRWRSASVAPADKYTEEEAETALQALSHFMRIAAAACDAAGRRV